VQKNNFHLQKWYFDSIDEKDNLAIAYITHISWKKIKISFSSLLLKKSSGKLKVRNSLKKQSLPVHQLQSLSFDNSLYTIQLHAKKPGISEKLFESEKGCIEWLCYYPSADISIDYGKECVRGSGYAEELRMSLKPWELKIKELHWGRYISETESVVWIQWRGDWSKFFIWHNGKRITEGEINESQVSFGNFTLKFDEPIMLRSGPVYATAFKKSLLFRILFPFKIMQSEETKWMAKAKLYLNTEINSVGKCIYEKVIWNE
jgi:hypothetical protein